MRGGTKHQHLLYSYLTGYPDSCTTSGIYTVLTFQFFYCIGYNLSREYMDMGIYCQVARIRKAGISDVISASISPYDMGFTLFANFDLNGRVDYMIVRILLGGMIPEDNVK